MGGCFSSESKDPGPGLRAASAPPPAASVAPQGRRDSGTAGTNTAGNDLCQQVDVTPEPAGASSADTQAPVPGPRPAPAAAASSQPPATSPSNPDSRRQSLSPAKSLPANGAGNGNGNGNGNGPSTITSSQGGGDDAAARTLAAGGTLLVPPPLVARDSDVARSAGPGGSASITGAAPPAQTTVTTLGPAASSDTGSALAAAEGSAANLQPSGFQCMPAALLAKEVAQLSWVGHGGYGAVYKGVWQGANVAVKFTVADYMDFAGASAHEATLSKMLSHPNVVQTFASRVALLDEEFLRSVFDGDTNFPSRELPVDSFRSGEGFGSPYGVNTSMKFRDVLTHIGARPGHYITQMIMEYCDRGSLHQAIAKGLFKSSSKWNNKIALRALLRTAREIAQGMSHLHACRVVHGDLKPGNVLLMSSRADRRGFTAKVSDFGLSTYCMASHTSVTRWSTVSYMAPEAFEGHLTMGSDTFSFGVLLWEMYTGQQPYAGLQAAQIVMGVQAGQLSLEWPPDSDPRIIECVESCIAREPAARPTFNQLITQLTQLEAHIRLEAPPSDGASDLRMPLLGGGATAAGGGGGAGAVPGGGSGTAPPLPPPPPPAAAAPQVPAEPALPMLSPPPLPAEEVVALVPPPLPEEPTLPMLVPPPLPPEEEEALAAAAAAAAFSTRAAPEDVQVAV